MILAKLSNSKSWKPLIHPPVLTRSLGWISQNVPAVTEGIHELGETGWFVNVHGYTTQESGLCVWENHPGTIDIQYMIEGIERIDVAPVEGLGEPSLYKPESDTQKFSGDFEPSTQVILRAGDFVILMPGEAHRPKVAAGEPALLKKLVVKVPLGMLDQHL